MSEHVVDVSWSRGEHEFTYPSYSRDHTWTFDGGDTVTATLLVKWSRACDDLVRRVVVVPSTSVS